MLVDLFIGYLDTISIYLYARLRSTFKSVLGLFVLELKSVNDGKGYLYNLVILFNLLKYPHTRRTPSFFLTECILDTQQTGSLTRSIIPFHSICAIQFLFDSFDRQKRSYFRMYWLIIGGIYF